MRSLLVIILSGVLTACGGGGSESGSANTPGGDNVASPDTAPSTVEASALTMEELIIPDGFNFSTLRTLRLQVDRPDFSSERSFVSLYHDYLTESLQPEPTSKIITAELINGKITLDFTLNNAELPVLAEIQGLESGTKVQALLDFTSGVEVWTE